jgi:iron(III) transport system permease protein
MNKVMPLSKHLRIRNVPLKRLATVGAFLVITVLPVLLLATQWLIAIFTGSTNAFSWAFPSQRSLQLLCNSLMLAIVVTFMSLMFGTGLAIWLTGDKPIHKFIRTIYLVPLLIPPYIHALEWMAVAGNRQFLNQILNSLPGMKNVTLSTYGFIPASFVLTFALFPIVTLLIRRGLAAIQPELLEIGWLSDNSWQVLRRIIVPLIMPSIVAAAGLIFVLVLVEYGVPSLLQYNVFIMEVYTSFSLYFNSVRAFATALPVIVIAVILLATSQLGLKNSPLQARLEQSHGLITNHWPIAARVFLYLCAIFWILASSVPLIVLFIRGGSPYLFYSTFINNFREIRLTIIIAAIAGCLTTLIAVPLAMVLTRRISRLWWLIFALPLAIPAPLVGISMISIWNNSLMDWGYNTWLMLILVQAARFLPFALFTASTGVRNIDPVLLEASQLPNTGFLHRMTKVTLPLFAPTIIMAWLMTFIFALGELGASLLVTPPGQSTLPITIYNLLHYGATNTVSAMSLNLLIIAGVACGILFMIYKRMLRTQT